MRSPQWSLQDAKNSFSAVVAAAQKGIPQTVTKRGKPAAVVLSIAEYRRLSRRESGAVPSFVDHLLGLPRMTVRSNAVGSDPAALIFNVPARHSGALRAAQAGARCRHRKLAARQRCRRAVSLSHHYGRGRARRRGSARPESRFAESLGAWLDHTIATYRDRILPVDTAVARRWGQLCSRIGHGSADLLIAATALEHGLSVVT